MKRVFIGVPLLALAVVIGHRIMTALFTGDFLNASIGLVFMVWCCIGVDIMVTHKLVRDV